MDHVSVRAVVPLVTMSITPIPVARLVPASAVLAHRPPHAQSVIQSVMSPTIYQEPAVYLFVQTQAIHSPIQHQDIA